MVERAAREATAGDELATRAVEEHLLAAGHDVVSAWSPAMSLVRAGPRDQRYDDVDPRRVDVAVWVCGPLAGQPVHEFHTRFAHSRRLAVGVSVLDASDPAVAGFDAVVPRDAAGVVPQRDLAARPPVEHAAVVGVFSPTARASTAAAAGTSRCPPGSPPGWAGWTPRRGARDPARPRDWRLPARAEHVAAVVARLDVVVSTRLHGLVLALRAGVPCVAVDPVGGRGKVSAQARAWGGPSCRRRGQPAALDEGFAWCRSRTGRDAARAAREVAATAGEAQLASLDSVLARRTAG